MTVREVTMYRCEKAEKADYAPLSRAQWQTWLDQHPGWRPRR